jgi:hypothetical protein
MFQESVLYHAPEENYEVGDIPVGTYKIRLRYWRRPLQIITVTRPIRLQETHWQRKIRQRLSNADNGYIFMDLEVNGG